MTQRCKCEHWQDCPTCAPTRFDAEGKRKLPEPTPLQVCRSEIEMMRETLACMEAALESLVKRCNTEFGIAGDDAVIRAEAVLERLYRARTGKV